MRELAETLDKMGGYAPSKAAVYMQLSYRGRSSNYFGSGAMNRAISAGLIEELPAEGSRIPVALTPLGEDVAMGLR